LDALERAFWNLHSYTWDDKLQTPGTKERIQARVYWLTRFYPRANGRVLDVGCGTGNYALALAEKGFNVVGIDFASEMLKTARAKAKRLEHASLTFEQINLNRALPFSAESFDHALCVLVLQVVHDPSRFLCEIRRVLKPNGRFLVVVPALEGARHEPGALHQRTTLPRWIFAKIKALASKSKRVRKYTRDELSELVINAGFEVVEERISSTIEILARR
jgi:ubiquinone/menaquinone biosynthesis C-methylase UbiE